jgi:hypothetical protein
MRLAPRKSCSAFRTHSRAALFIEELSFGHNFGVERFTLGEAPAEVVRRAHDQLQWKRRLDCVVNPERCIDLIPARHNDQDIHVAVFVGHAVSVGAEEDDLVGLEALGDIAGEPPNDAQGHIWARVMAPCLIAEFGVGGHERSLQCGEPQLQSGRKTGAKFGPA